MAWLEKRRDKYHICFWHSGRHFSRSLKITNPRKAESAKARLEENLADLERGRLELPDGADLITFLLSDGKLARRVVFDKELTLGELFKRYQEELPSGAKEANTRYTEDIHIGHLLRLIGSKTPVRCITTEALQKFANERSVETGWYGKQVSDRTIRKEIGTLSSVWNRWAAPLRLVTGPAPTRGLIYRKSRPKSPFHTWAQVERQLARANLEKDQERELWDSVFLTLAEIDQVLEHVRKTGRFPFLYAMFVFAARTGARRSEILRSQLDDFDFTVQMVRIREKKKDRSKELTFRHVPLSPLLSEVMQDWFAVHPGGNLSICQKPNVPISAQMANHYFVGAVGETKWSKLRGWHVFRHSFASNCAAKNVDQRVIDEWMGHQTEEMRKRYRHLFPQQQHESMRLVFADR